MSEQMIEYMDVGHGRVKPDASIPLVGRLQLGQPMEQVALWKENASSEKNTKATNKSERCNL